MNETEERRRRTIEVNKLRTMTKLRFRRRRKSVYCAVVAVAVVVVVAVLSRGWGETKWSPTNDVFRKDLNAYPFQFKMNPRKVCETRGPEVLFVVPSRPDSFKARDAVRRTWGNKASLRARNFTLAFIIGESKVNSLRDEIEAESKRFEDLIQADFLDTYLNLTLKSVVMLRWAASYCQNAQQLFKVDEDVYVYMDKFASLVDPRRRQRHSVTGHVVLEAPVIRDPEKKFFVSKDDYAAEVYPTYALGAAYGISGDLVPKLYETSQKTQLFKFEDVYVTGFLAAQTKAHFVNSDDLNFKTFAKCRHETKIIDHGFSPKQMINFHSKILDPGVDMSCGFWVKIRWFFYNLF